MTVKTGIDAYRENKQAQWPSVVATITRLTVQKIPAPKSAIGVWL